MKVCNCCDQVLPETDEDKATATAKTAVAREQVQAAQTAWNTFENAHPIHKSLVRNFGLRGVLSAVIGLLTYSIVGFSGVYSDAVGTFILLAAFLAVLVVALLFYVLVKRPSKMISLHIKAVRNAFILRHKEQAGCLGFTMCSN